MFRCALPAALVALAVISVTASAQPPLDASALSCQVIDERVDAAGELQVLARRPGNEKPSLYTFVRDSRACRFADERATDWPVEGADGEVCRQLRICITYHHPAGR